MPSPLDQFADRLIRNGEIEKFVDILVQKGGDRILSALIGAVNKHRYEVSEPPPCLHRRHR